MNDCDFWRTLLRYLRGVERRYTEIGRHDLAAEASHMIEMIERRTNEHTRQG